MKKGCLGFFIVLIVALVFGTIYAIQNADKLGATPEGKLAKTIDTTPEQALVVMEILKQSGVEKFDDIQRDELLDNANADGEKGYRINSGDANNIILYMLSDGTVNILRWSDNDLYAGGKNVSKLSDYILTNQEKTNLQLQSQEAIKGLLKSPSTAKFPNILKWSIGKQDGITIVQSYVDAQNSFGAETRSEFQFKIKEGKVVSLIFDGEEYIN